MVRAFCILQKCLAPLIYEGGCPEGAGGSSHPNKFHILPPASLRSSTPLINEGGEGGRRKKHPNHSGSGVITYLFS